LMAWTAAKMNIFAGGAVVKVAVTATKMIDGLAGEGF
jgi:hypothetical protein